MFNIDSSINYVCEVSPLIRARALSSPTSQDWSPDAFLCFQNQPDQTSSDVCCCSSVSFTLFQACRSCQTGSLPTANSSTPDQTYSSYLHSCPQASITNASLASNLSSSGLSSWAFRGVSSTGTWDYSGALANATKEGVYRAEGAYKGLSSGAKAGVAIVVILLVAAGAVGFYKYALPRIRCVAFLPSPVPLIPCPSPVLLFPCPSNKDLTPSLSLYSRQADPSSPKRRRRL